MVKKSISSIGETRTGTTISCQRRPVINGNEEILHIPQISINEDSPSDDLDIQYICYCSRG